MKAKPVIIYTKDYDEGQPEEERFRYFAITYADGQAEMVLSDAAYAQEAPSTNDTPVARLGDALVPGPRSRRYEGRQ